MFKCLILLKPALRGEDGSLHFPILSMNRLNQNEPATFAVLLFWAFFRGSFFFLYFVIMNSICFCDRKLKDFMKM